ncbi:hypothetical protein NDU88_001758 [Pleurodeles waltl]|uniref:SGNH hydrolase-type esterase domain-containing protein n=1 Tax=Pleurodeles waltl TaxID=8319 RepID=A0AAV7M076_PLEWA|nr:hypothetical protein NDU88_001758 [Pleurodeles waltl]
MAVLPGHEMGTADATMPDTLGREGKRNAVVMHLGGNDLTCQGSKDLLGAMAAGLMAVALLVRPAEVIWSEIIGRARWRGAQENGAVEQSRTILNISMSKLCRANSWGFVRHGVINLRTPGYCVVEGVHLSGVGIDMFLLNIVGELERLRFS